MDRLSEIIKNVPSYDLFISHRSEDNTLAQKIYDVVVEMHPEWNVFFDKEKSLEQGSGDYKNEILKALKKTKKLIWVSSDEKLCQKGSGWQFFEVDKFHTFMQTSGDSGFNVDYFGLVLNTVDKEKLPDVFKGYEAVDISGIDDITQSKIQSLLDGTYCSIRYRRILFEKSKEFAVRKNQTNQLFSPKKIDEKLLVSLSDYDEGGDEKRDYSFEDLINILEKRNALALAGDGGAGKTTLLTKVFYYYLELENSPYVPVFIDVNSITEGAQGNLIIRYILKELYNETQIMSLADGELGGRVQELYNEFTKETESPEYIFVIDGLNEISKKQSDKIIDECSEFSNVRILCSSRAVEIDKFSSYRCFELNKLTPRAIEAYIGDKIDVTKFNDKLIQILSIPMYLDKFVESKLSGDKIETRGDLLSAFLKYQEKRDNSEKSTFILNYILPAIAYCAVSNPKYKLSNQIEKEELFDLLNDILSDESEFLGKNTLFHKCYLPRYNREILNYFDRERETKKRERNEFIVEYLTDTLGLMRINNIKFNTDNDEYNIEYTLFIHQVYRDFFCSIFIANEIKLASKNFRPVSLTKIKLSNDVISFVSDLLKEEKNISFCDCENECWNYRCNEQSFLYKTLDCFRGDNQDSVATSNIIEILKYARKNDLSNCDFSNLNLTQSKLIGCLFYRFYKEKEYPSNFESSIIDRKNILCEKHDARIETLCLKGNILAIYDSSKTIKLWNISDSFKFPVKVFSDIRYDIRQMHFGNDTNHIIASSDYEIFEIDLSDDEIDTCNYKVLYKSKNKLKNLYVEKDAIKFSTFLNPFNIKNIDDPEKEDAIHFSGLNSSMAIRADNKQLVFGHVVGYETLKIYNYDDEAEDWIDTKFGYTSVLEKYILSIEKKLKDFNLYYLFPDDNKYMKKAEGAEAHRGSFFTNLQEQMEDRGHNYKEIAGIIYKRITKELAKKHNIKLHPKQKKSLKELGDIYINDIDSVDFNLLRCNGKRVSSVEYKENSDVILVASSFEYKEGQNQENDKRTKEQKKKKWDFVTAIFEINTKSYETRFVTRVFGDSPAKAMYSDGKILAFSDKIVKVIDGAEYNELNRFSSATPNCQMRYDKRQRKLYILCDAFVYRMNENLIIEQAFFNPLKSPFNMYLCANEVTDKTYFKNKGDEFVDLDNVLLVSKGDVDFENIVYLNENVYDEYSFKITGSKLAAYCNEQRIKEVEIPYMLMIAKCNFRGIKGDADNYDTLADLKAAGAYVDSEEHILSVDVTGGNDDFNEVCYERYDDTEMYIEYLSLFSSKKGYEELVSADKFNFQKGKGKLVVQETWRLINKGLYLDVIKTSDLTILEWINKLKYATADMIFDLMVAGIVEPPDTDAYNFSRKRVAERMNDTLHKSYKLLRRFKFDKKENLFVYNLSTPYGADVLMNFNGSKAYVHNHKMNPATVLRILACNRWFTRTLRWYEGNVEDYDLHVNININASVIRHRNTSVGGYIIINNQPIFVEAIRSDENEKYISELVEKLKYLSIISNNHNDVAKLFKAHAVSKKPIVFLVCESIEHIKAVNEILKQVHLNINIFYVLDVNHYNMFENICFECNDDGIFKINIDDLISDSL